MEISVIEQPYNVFANGRTAEEEVRKRPYPADEGIVVVGASCRFPGSESLDAYWRNLLEARHCVAEVDRWPLSVRAYGGLLDNIAGFDAGFFRISPKEARCMDPQQRILMEVAHHAIEDSGAGLAALRELRCGVFCTSLPGDYKFLLAEDRELAFSNQSFLGNAAASLSGRISYFYDFKGPSLTLDTACSSSLTALQIAILQLRAGECGAALVASASIFATSEIFEFGQRAGMLSQRGSCATFSAVADGFVPSEGVAAIMLTTRQVADRLGLEVLATIEAIALNHDGLSNGLMAPNAQAQRDLIAGLYRRNGIAISEVGYVEAHGTGTRLGDPIEMRGLVGAFDDISSEVAASGSLDQTYDAWIGASKSVIGHTLVSSGLASVLKVILMLRHATIPPHPPFGEVNPDIEFGRFRINNLPVPWPAGKHYAAVSAFGFTGSNGHVVLGRGDARIQASAPQATGPFPFLFSAHSRDSLVRLLHAHAESIVDHATANLAALSTTLVSRTMQHRYRAAILASSRTELLAGLRLLEAPEHVDRDRLQVCGDAAPALIAMVERWLDGDDTTFADVRPDAHLPKIPVPPYPFEHRDFWVGIVPAAPPQLAAEVAPDHMRMLETLKLRLAEALGFAVEDIDASCAMRDFGIDSITIIQMLAQLGPVAARMQPHDVFDYPSLEAFARDLVTHDAQRPSPQTKAARIARATTQSLLRWRNAGDGRGRPVLLLPPLNMGDDAWCRQINFLRRIGMAPQIAVYPGHLDNPLDPEVRDGSTVHRDAIVDAFATTIRNEFGSVPLIGWSLGGCFGLDLAIRAPELVSSLILVSTAAKFDGDVFGRTLDLHGELEANADMLDILLGSSDRIVERLGAGANMNVLSGYYRMLGDFDVSGQLPQVNTRTLIVHGHRDAVVGDSDLALLRRLPNAEVAEMHDQGHFIPLLAAPRFNCLVGDFLKPDIAVAA
jgi:3-oxoacyl-(acyl-carrier-protein) synthase/pimeloyl-ACP methyl ester carboxylesterase